MVVSVSLTCLVCLCRWPLNVVLDSLPMCDACGAWFSLWLARAFKFPTGWTGSAFEDTTPGDRNKDITNLYLKSSPVNQSHTWIDIRYCLTATWITARLKNKIVVYQLFYQNWLNCWYWGRIILTGSYSWEFINCLKWMVLYYQLRGDRATWGNIGSHDKAVP